MNPERHVADVGRHDACEPFVGLIARAADGSIDASGQARLSVHLEHCAHCTMSLETQRAARAVLAAWAPDPAPPDFVATVLGAIDARETWIDRWDFRRWTWRLAPLATAMAVATVVVMGRTDVSFAEQANAIAASDVTVAGALASDELSESDVLALLLTASADDPVVEALEEIEQ
jgi:anti-sigma factor RsiW